MSENIILTCPFCNDAQKHHHHLSVSLEKNVYFCYLCGAKGRFSFLLEKFPNLRNISDLKNISELELAKIYNRSNLGKYFFHLWEKKTAENVAAAVYLKNRGLSAEDIKKFKVSVCPELPGRVVFPDLTEGAPVFWSARTIGKSTPKWLFPKTGETKVSKSQYIWGLELIPREEKFLFVCEGIFDAVAARGVCVFGKNPSAEQVKKLVRLCVDKNLTFVIGFDDDAIADAKALASRIKGLLPVKVMPPENEHDYGNLLEKHLRREVGSLEFK